LSLNRRPSNSYNKTEMTNCSKCGEVLDIRWNFCRRCGEGIATTPQSVYAQADQLTGRGIATTFLGDGFLIVAVILSAAQSPVKSPLWLLMLIPAFLFFW